MTHLVIIPCSRSAPRRLHDALRSAVGAVGARARGSIAPLASSVATLPAWSWPSIATATAWPSLAWVLRRSGDGSDDPFGIVAWVALAVALLTARRRFDHPPRPYLLFAAAGVALFASLPVAALPDLLRALLATCAIVLALAAIVDDDEPFLPYAGFALLGLPLLSALQFDVAMAWVGYFTACFSAWLFRSSNGAMTRRLPLVGLLIVAGDVVRNIVLVALEVRHGPVDRAPHAAIDFTTFATLAIVCTAIVALFASCRDRVRALQRIRVESSGRFSESSAQVRPGPVVVVGLFAVAALLPLVTSA